MKKKVILILVATLLVVFFVTNYFYATEGQWKYLGKKDYQLLYRIDNVPLVFENLQDADKRKIGEAIEKNPDVVKTWTGLRPNIVPEFNVKKILKDNNVGSTQMEIIDIDFGETFGKKGKIAKIYFNNKTILAADPDHTPFRLIPSSDFSRYLIVHDDRELWFIDDPVKCIPKKISKDTYEGKSISELLKSISGRDDRLLYWISNPMFSPDGNKVAFISNRDCLDRQGSSIWINDLTTNNEYALVRSINGEYYNLIGWFDSENVLCVKYDKEGSTYYVIDMKGNIYGPFLNDKDVVAIYRDGKIAYTDNSSKKIYVSQYDFNNHDIKSIYDDAEINGEYLIKNSFHFSPDGSALSLAYAADTNGTLYIKIINLNNKKEIILKDSPSGEWFLFNNDWIDNTRLLVYTENWEKGVREVSTYIYRVDWVGM